MTVLVLAPHPDDEALGCGGAVCRHVDAGDRVMAVFLTSGELGLKQLPRAKAWRIREAEARKSCSLLGVSGLSFLRLPDWFVADHLRPAAPRLRVILQREKPELIYLPHPDEWHPDHQASLPLLRAALRGLRSPQPTLRGYEIWTPLTRYDHVEDVSRVMSRKLKALRAHRSQVADWDYVRAITGLNQYRGISAARCRYAEVFCDLSLTEHPRTNNP